MGGKYIFINIVETYVSLRKSDVEALTLKPIMTTYYDNNII